MDRERERERRRERERARERERGRCLWPASCLCAMPRRPARICAKHVARTCKVEYWAQLQIQILEITSWAL